MGSKLSKKKKAPTVTLPNGLTPATRAMTMNPELSMQQGPMNWTYDVKDMWEYDEFAMDKLCDKMDGTQSLRFARWICKQLCCTKQNEKSLCADQGVVDSMVVVLRKFGCDDKLVAVYACAAITLFSRDNDTVRTRLVELGAVEAVIAVLDSFANASSSEWFVCFEACIALYTLQPNNACSVPVLAKVVASFAEHSVERGKLGILACTMLYTLHRANPSTRIIDEDNGSVIMGIESIASSSNNDRDVPVQWNSDAKAQFRACSTELISWLNNNKSKEN